MKKNKLIASAIAAVFMLALTGCDLTIRDKYVAVSVGDVKKTSDGVYELYITNDKGYETVDGNKKAINCSKYGTTWAEQDSSKLKFNNPLAELNPEAYKKVTISYSIYKTKDMTYSGAFGIYDTSTGGFLWLTNAGLHMNNTANLEGLGYSQYYCDCFKKELDNSIENDAWSDIVLEVTKDAWSYKVDGTEKLNNTSIQTKGGDVKDMFNWFFNNADTCRVGTGATFWDNPGADTWISDIKISVE